MVDSVCSREPRRRYRGTTRPAKVSPRRNPGSAFGRGLQAWGVVARSCADLRSIRPSDWRRPRYPAAPAGRTRSMFVVRDFGRSWRIAAPDKVVLTMLDQAPNGCQDNNLRAAGQSSATADPPTIGDDAFCLRDSCNVVDQKIHVFRTAAVGGGIRVARQPRCSGAEGSRQPRK